MTRYLRQRNQFTCAPVAILNALKWTGRYLTGGDLQFFINACRTTRAGTETEDMRRVIDRHIPRNKFLVGPSRQTLSDYLLWDRAIILNYGYVTSDEAEEWHSTFCAGRVQWGLGYQFVNDVDPKTGDILPDTVSFRDHDQFREMVGFVGRYGDRCEAWLI